MNVRMQLGVIAAFATAMLIALLLWWHAHAGGGRLPYQDRFAAGSMAGWKEYGGSWQVSNGAVQNNSDDTGSKLVTGSPSLQNYRVQADVQLLNNFGDAGVMLRVQKPEVGVNAFFGYYLGVRLPNEVRLGEMDYGFILLQQQTLATVVRPGVWYHLDVAVNGCSITGVVSLPGGAPLGSVRHDGEECPRTGSFGLRSFGAGGSWRNVRVEALP